MITLSDYYGYEGILFIFKVSKPKQNKATITQKKSIGKYVLTVCLPRYEKCGFAKKKLKSKYARVI